MSNSLRKMGKDKTLAELASVNRLLGRLDESDLLSRMGLESRQSHLKTLAERLPDEVHDTLASVAIFFGGAPVVANKGIESEFAALMVNNFQDLISKMAANLAGPIGKRGVVPKKELSKLHITNIVRGSFGFTFEELSSQPSLLDSTLKSAVDNSLALINAFAEDNEDEFQDVLVQSDQRVVDSVEDFFKSLRKHKAKVRLVSGDTEKTLGEKEIDLGLQRAKSTRFKEGEKNISGKLSGALSHFHTFELVLTDDDIIKGQISDSITAQEIELWVKNYIGENVNAKVHFKKIIRNNDTVRTTYILNSLADNN